MNDAAAQGQLAPGLALHAVWWVVLKPKMVVLANGQPAFDAVAQVETLAEASAIVMKVPGGIIVQNVAVFINGGTVPLVRQ